MVDALRLAGFGQFLSIPVIIDVVAIFVLFGDVRVFDIIDTKIYFGVAI